MSKKIVLFIICCLLLTGCGNDEVKTIARDSISYNLDISSSFKENIIFSFINEKKYFEIDEDFDGEYEDFLPTIANNNIRSLYYDDSKIYRKKIDRQDDVTNIELYYEYTEEEFVYPNLIMSCFENYEISSKDDYFEMKLMGKFSCLNNMSKVDININTDYEVMDTNADVDGNKYHWVIDKDNEDFTFIKFKIKRDYNQMEEGSINNNGSGIFIGIIKIIGLFGGMFLLYKLYEKIKNKIDL